MAQTRGNEVAFVCPKRIQEAQETAKITCSVLGIILSPLISCSNGLVLVSILRSPRLRVPSNILICLLAFSDFLVGSIFLPVQTGWLLNDNLHESCAFFMLKMVSGWLFIVASFLSVVAVSCERFLALFKPLKYPNLVTISRVGIVGCVIWSISILLLVIYLLSSKRIASGIAIVLAILGILVIFYVYYRIFKLVRKHHGQIRTQQEVSNAIDGNTAERAHQRKLAVTMGYAIGVFLVCYAPSVANLLESAVSKESRSDSLLVFTTLTVYAFSSLCNPLIYCGRTGEIRVAVMTTLKAIKGSLCGKSVGISNNNRVSEIRIRCSSFRNQDETKPQLQTKINKTDHSLGT